MTSGDFLFQSIDPAAPADEAPVAPTAPVSQPVESRPRPTPHQSKLMELQSNNKVPPIDHLRIAAAIQRYNQWIADMRLANAAGEAKVRRLVQLLNEYKRYIEVDLIWDSDEDFLFRQRGQLKIDNSILEEFLPWLVDVEIIPELAQVDCFAGPASAFAAVYFSSTLASLAPNSIGLKARTKDQDFTLSRPAYMRASFDKTLSSGVSEQQDFWLTYLAAECKTNLDKTMFQEAAATSHDLKIAVPAARYYLICEYLDMTPISSAGTDIDEVLILRGKRLASNVRSRYSTSAGRVRLRGEYINYLDRNPIREDVILRFVEHLRSLLTRRDPLESDVLERGYF
ncbi:MAG: Bpu10I family restriction endonuclease [Streptosporangiaceae bacterium]|nr:Bpu10I family restriction endonuclease [Streptosporangiaceae bacterium]